MDRAALRTTLESLRDEALRPDAAQEFAQGCEELRNYLEEQCGSADTAALAAELLFVDEGSDVGIMRSLLLSLASHGALLANPWRQ